MTLTYYLTAHHVLWASGILLMTVMYILLIILKEVD